MAFHAAVGLIFSAKAALDLEDGLGGSFAKASVAVGVGCTLRSKYVDFFTSIPGGDSSGLG